MTKTANERFVEAVKPLNMNGLQGRMLRLPPRAGKKKRELLFVYGRHSSLERWWGLLQNLNRYGGVTAADLPGFGGMESLYRLGTKPTLDNLADYLAAFVKLRYQRRRLVIVAECFGFVVVTRMLQRYPDIARKVDAVVSLGGFAHHDDLALSHRRVIRKRLGAWWFSRRVSAWWLGRFTMDPAVVRWKTARSTKKPTRQLVDFHLALARQNDTRTLMFTTLQLLKLDNCQRPVAVPLWHVSLRADRDCRPEMVEQHLRIIFSEVHFCKAATNFSSPLTTASAKLSAPLLPLELQRALARL